MRRAFLTFAFLTILGIRPGIAGVLHIEAYDSEGHPLSTQKLLEYIAPASQKGRASPATSGLLVTDIDGNPVPGRPWWVSGSSMPRIAWRGASRVKLSLPWPVADNGFSNVYLDKNGDGYADDETVLLNEEIASTQYRLFRDSVKDRRSVWAPTYKPGRDFERLRKDAEAAMASAYGAKASAARARLFEEALTQISAAWAKALFEHGVQLADHPKTGPSLRWGLTLDESLTHRLADYELILKELRASGADWVRLVFRLNPDDFIYANRRSFNEYDRVVSDLAQANIRVMGSVLDSSLWRRNLTARALRQRTANLVLHYKGKILSWEVASEPNGTCLGGCGDPLPDDAILDAVTAAADEAKRIDPSIETVATLYWWEGTAGDDRHPTFIWLKRALPRGAFAKIDLVALSVYPEDNPMGMAFDTAFRELGLRFPSKRLMLGGFDYAEHNKLHGYWWFDPTDVDGAREDLIQFYTGAACAIPRSAGGGFWWQTLSQMASRGRKASGTLQIYKRVRGQINR